MASFSSAGGSSGSASAPKIAYYVTGHGFGHATRTVGFIEHLLRSGFEVDVVSSLASDFFPENLANAGMVRDASGAVAGLTVHHRCVDAGALQSDALTMDVPGTLTNYLTTIHAHRATLLEAEAAYLRARRPDVVLCDVSALGCAAASLCGLPAVLLSNFTWDAIYRDMADGTLQLADQPGSDALCASNLADMVAAVTADYCEASHYLQLPGQMQPPPGFAGTVLPAPLLCRHPRTPASETRARLGIDAHAKVVVYGFGGQARSEAEAAAFSERALPDGWVCLVLMAAGEAMPSARFIGLPRDVYVPDILAAADVMVGKLGYGTCSECLVTGTPLVFVSRTHWAEEPPLRALMDRFDACVEMARDDLLSGRWGAALERAAEKGRRGWDVGPLRAAGACVELEGVVRGIAAAAGAATVGAAAAAAAAATVGAAGAGGVGVGGGGGLSLSQPTPSQQQHQQHQQEHQQQHQQEEEEDECYTPLSPEPDAADAYADEYEGGGGRGGRRGGGGGGGGGRQTLHSSKGTRAKTGVYNK